MSAQHTPGPDVYLEYFEAHQQFLRTQATLKFHQQAHIVGYRASADCEANNEALRIAEGKSFRSHAGSVQRWERARAAVALAKASGSAA